MIKVIEAFSGIGSQRVALERLGLEHKVVGIFEIDKHALQSYNAMFGDAYKLNLGDISTVKLEDIPDCDLFTYSFPCQSISNAGKQEGLKEGSGTTSSLLWDCRRIIEHKRPKYLLMENVKNLVGKNFIEDFYKWLKVLEGFGYTNYWKVLNAKDYGIPQNRERVFCVSVLGEHEPYVFPQKEELKTKLSDLLDSEVDEKFYLTQRQIDKINFSKFNSKRKQIQEKDWCDTLCARDFKDPKCVKIEQVGQYDTPKRKNTSIFRVYDKEYLAPTLTSMGGGNLEPHIIEDEKYPYKNIEKDFRVRKLTPKECWRLMGFSDKYFQKAEEVCSNSQLYKQAGNSIVVDVLEKIFYNLFK